jgi:hypothetical protein
MAIVGRSIVRRVAIGMSRRRLAVGLLVMAGLPFGLTVAGVTQEHSARQDRSCTDRRISQRPTLTYRQLQQDVLIDADYWELEPRILAAGLGFTEIIGVPGLVSPDLDVQRDAVLAVGGAWNTVDTSEDDVATRAYTSATTPMAVALSYGWPVQFCDGLPMEFSWPVRPSTVDATDFRITLNTGEVVTPFVASVFPNFEFNERSTVVMFADFGDRLPPGEPGARFPVHFEIVRDETPLQLIGPGGEVFTAVGLTFGDGETPLTAYQPNKGPSLVAAKLSRMSIKGEGGPPGPVFTGQLPNDGIALYGDQAKYRLRILTTGGFSPDGVRSLLPTEFSRYFRLRAIDSNGDEHVIDEAGHNYLIDGGQLTVLGLADLGLYQAEGYDDAYVEDHDNQYDIVLSGDDVAMRTIRSIEVPAGDGFDPVYNPGGPGNDPQVGDRYSEPGPVTVQSVTIALEDPMTVDWPPADS